MFLMLFSLRWLFVNKLGSENNLREAVFFALLAYAYTLAPIPWQWTKDGRRKATFPIGVLQALIWNSLIQIPILSTLISLHGPGAILGQDKFSTMVRLGVPPSNFSMGLVLFGYGLLISMLIGWFISREESNKYARAEAEDARRTLEFATRQAQAHALQAQLDPHVLYNALSGIAELIRDDPKKAEEAVLNLSDLYRLLTDLGKRSSISLREERRLMEDYLAVEQMRLGSRMRVSWDWPTELNDLEVPPLLVQPLVENAIKHGLSPQEEGGALRIGVWRKADSALHVEVMNNGAPLDPSWESGTGLSNLSARLELLGAGSGITLRQEGEWTVASLDYRPSGVP